RRRCSHSGLGPTLTPSTRRRVNRGQPASSCTSTVSPSSRSGSPASRPAAGCFTLQPSFAPRSRATPSSEKASARFGDSSSSITVSSGHSSASGAPTGASGPNVTIPPAWSKMPSSLALASMPSLSTPCIVRVPTSPGTPGRRAPGLTRAPSWPAATFGAPHTTCTAVPGTVTTTFFSPFVPGIGSASSMRATSTPSGAGGRRWTVSTARPRPDSRSVSSPTSGSASSKNSWSQETGTLTADLRGRRRRRRGLARASQPPPELAQDAHVVLVEVPDVRHAVGHHRQALDAEAEGEARHALVADRLEHLRVHHPAAAQLEPLLLAGARVRPPDRELGARLDEREVGGQQVRPRVLADDRARHLVDRAAQVGHRDALAHDERLELVELRLVGGVDGLVAEHLPGHDDLEGRRVRLHVPDLHRAGVGAQQAAVGRPERVLRVARRVLGREVQRPEVVVVGLELGARHDLV